MSPSAGTLLVEEIAPRLRAAIPKSVQPVGAEDAEELVQDGIMIAAQMLDSVERRGRTVTPGNIAYFVILHMRSGRRSHTAGRSDVMTPAAQLDAKSCVLSFEEEVGYDPELDGPVTLGELLASEHEDPAQIGGRNVDWELFLSAHDYRYGVIAHAFASGGTLRDAAKMLHASYGSVYPLKARLAVALREFLGPESIADAARVPRWKASITVDREKTACQRDRRRSAH